MGDILYIFKHRINGNVVTRRGVVTQVKYTNGIQNRWRIDVNQFRLLCNWPPFRLVRPAFNANHTIIPITRTWSMYAFVGPNALNYPVFYSAKRILGHRGNIPNQQSFTYYTLPNYYWDIDTSFY